MKITVVPKDSTVIVDGVSSKVDLADFPSHHVIHFDTDAGVGVEEFAEGETVDHEERDVAAEDAAWAAARAAGTPEALISVPVMTRTVKVKRPHRQFTDFAPFQAALDRWLDTPREATKPSDDHDWDVPTRSWVPNGARQADTARNRALDSAIGAATYGTIQPATLAQLKAMDNAAYSAWFDANVTNAPTPAAAAVALLKLLTRVIIRRVL